MIGLKTILYIKILVYIYSKLFILLSSVVLWQAINSPVSTLKFPEILKSKLLAFHADTRGQIISYYMTILLATIVVLSVIMPIVIDQIAAVTANVSAVTKTVLDLLGLMLALTLLILYMRPLM